MNPNEKGWLKEYLEFRQELLKDIGTDSNHKQGHPEQSLYRIIQPTGLMYGQTVGNIENLQLENWNEKDKMKILLAESLISSSLLFNDKPVTTPDELSKVIFNTLKNIGNFYNNIFPEIATPSKTIFGKKRTPLEIAEKILDKRIEHTAEFEGNFWSHFFHNSLLFLDIFIFGQWIHTNADRIVADFFRYERDELRFSVVKVIAAAAHANKEVVYEEKKLVEFFIHSTNLPAEKRKEALRIFETGVRIEEINLPSENSWILRKYFLEMAILTIWADKKVEEGEMEFIEAFAKQLGFTDDDLENSLLAIEGFVLEHWKQLGHLQDKQDYDEVSEQFINRVARIAEKNKKTLFKEIQGSDNVMELLSKAKSDSLTVEEKEKARTDLIAILKTIPTFVIISLPQKFLTLPILLKILPKNIIPDAD
ncbi:hypothetical protein [Chryseosolibacter indicus]|uniref:TerB family tellurite resistance protein n=1 Tax=Chryseosolibacter indicus TaxID=2782351 RepID=A0ABS5VRY9_9BACT|nr:hypothetical protein [Chryseosolibacter indicus]MBT1704200.1 TerB family tellurite resistance protein [Chryseosolibacter indicus]